jgi:hypothetical protein
MTLYVAEELALPEDRLVVALLTPARLPPIDLRIIISAHRTASAIALTVAGIRVPPSYIASLRAARMLAAINSTRFLPSSIAACYTFAVCSPISKQERRMWLS